MIQSLKTRVLPLLLVLAWTIAACAPQQVTAPAPAAEAPATEATVASSEEATAEPAEEPTAEAAEEAASGDAVTLRITWYDDGNEGVILRELLDRFEADNPDIKVVVETVPYSSGILESLPLQLEAGEGPDVAAGRARPAHRER